jgi:hypothetical protein
MNIPKRASCHHFIRRARSAAAASAEVAGAKLEAAPVGGKSAVLAVAAVPPAINFM